MLIVVLVATAALVVLGVPMVRPIRVLALQEPGVQPGGISAPAGPLTRLQSERLGADIVVDGLVVTQTPADVAIAGHAVALRRDWRPDVSVLDVGSGTVDPRVVATERAARPAASPRRHDHRPEAPARRLTRSVASPGGLGHLQAWLLDPFEPREERVGSATRKIIGRREWSSLPMVSIV